MKRSPVIIGAGYSGLSCTALPAHDGWDVTVLEKNDQIGGQYTHPGVDVPMTLKASER